MNIYTIKVAFAKLCRSSEYPRALFYYKHKYVCKYYLGNPNTEKNNPYGCTILKVEKKLLSIVSRSEN